MIPLDALGVLHLGLTLSVGLVCMGLLSLSGYRAKKREADYWRAVKLQEIRLYIAHLRNKQRQGVEA